MNAENYLPSDNGDYLFYRLGERRRLMLEEMGLKFYPPRNIPENQKIEKEKAPEKTLEKPIISASTSLNPQNPECEKGQKTARFHSTPPQVFENAEIAPKENIWEISALQKIEVQADKAENADVAHWLFIIDTPFLPHSPLAKMLENLARVLKNTAQARALWVAHVGRPGSGVRLSDMVENEEKTTMYPLSQGLAEHGTSVAWQLIVLAGRTSAQAVLALDAALGALRAGDYVLDLEKITQENKMKIPAIVTYDLPYLLRAPMAKAAFWDDICRACERLENTQF